MQELQHVENYCTRVEKKLALDTVSFLLNKFIVTWCVAYIFQLCCGHVAY